MNPRELEEYRALRATIRERGTARVWIFWAGLTGWAALTVAVAALTSLPVASFLPLLVLAGTFEAVFSLHAGVERLGRYLQVFFEEDAGWEHTAMAFGPPLAGTGADPLFTAWFVLATLLNAVPALLSQPARVELIVVAMVHLLVCVRYGAARRAASRQRAADLKRFLAMRAGRGSSSPAPS